MPVFFAHNKANIDALVQKYQPAYNLEETSNDDATAYQPVPPTAVPHRARQQLRQPVQPIYKKSETRSFHEVYHPNLPSKIMIPKNYEIDSVLQIADSDVAGLQATHREELVSEPDEPQDDAYDTTAQTGQPVQADTQPESQPEAAEPDQEGAGYTELSPSDEPVQTIPQPAVLPHPPQALPHALSQLDAAIERLRLQAHEVRGPRIPVITISGYPQEVVYERQVEVPQPDAQAVPAQTSEAIQDHPELSDRQKLYLKAVLANYFKLIKTLQKSDAKSSAKEQQALKASFAETEEQWRPIEAHTYYTV